MVIMDDTRKQNTFLVLKTLIMISSKFLRVSQTDMSLSYLYEITVSRNKQYI